LGKVCDQFGGEVQTGPFGSQLHASDYTEDGTPIIMPQDMIDGKIVCDRIARVGPKHVSQLKRHMLRAGDVVYSRRGDVTRFAVVTKAEEGWLCGTGSIRIRLNCPEIEIGYVRRYLQQDPVGKWLKHHAKGVTMPNLNTDVIRALPFVYPPLAEQRRIAEVLDRAEALRAKRRAALAQLDFLTQSLFLDIFGDPATNPKGWPVSRVGDVADVQGGLQVTSARKNLPHEVPYLRVANVYRGFLDLSEIKTIRATDIEIARTKLVKDDLLIVEGHGNPAEIGRGALWDGSIAGCIHQNHIIRARFAPAKVVPLYACEYLNSPGGRRHLLRAGKTTSGLNTISVSEVRGTPVALPPIELQREFAHRIQAVEKLKAAQRASLAEMDALFVSLQHRAFRGEL
jgi:type I restriction enzyme S subunit